MKKIGFIKIINKKIYECIYYNATKHNLVVLVYL